MTRVNEPRLPPAVVALSPGALERADVTSFLERARGALGAGLPGLLLREARLDDRGFLEVARALRAAADEHGAWLGVHDRIHAALAAGADGVHLGFCSLAPEAARRAAGHALALGLSTHASDALERAAGCDYAFFGPIADVPAKAGTPAAPAAVGWPGLEARARAAGPCPLWAIGGLGPEDLERALAAGARGIAVLRGVFGAADSAAAARAYAAAWRAARCRAVGAGSSRP